MAEGNINIMNELGIVEPEGDDMREISAILVEEKIGNSVEPGFEGFGMDDDSYLLAADLVGKAVNPRINPEGSKDSTTLIEMEQTGEGSGQVRQDPPKSDDKVLRVPSRYLSRPCDSCHNMCKYGHKSNNEVKASSLLRTSNDCGGLGKFTSTLDPKRKSMVRRSSFTGTKEERLNMLLVEGMDLSPTHSNKTTARHIELGNNAAASLCAPGCLSSKAMTADNVDKTRVVPESSRRQNSKGSVSFCKSDKKFMGLDGTSICARPPLTKAVSINQSLPWSLDGLPHRDKENSINESKVYRNDDVPEKTLYMIELNDENKSKGAAEPAMNAKFLPHTPKKKWVGKIMVLKGSQTASCHAHMSSSAPSSASTKYKTTKMKSPSQCGEEQEEVGRVHGKKIDAVLQGGKAKTSKPKANLNAEITVKSKRADVSQSAGTDGPRPKMKFKRGTVVAFPGPNSSS